jgi:hypothetical protein
LLKTLLEFGEFLPWSLVTSAPKFGFFFRFLCNQSIASEPLKQLSTFLILTLCFLVGIPAWKVRTMSFQSLVALHGPLMTEACTTPPDTADFMMALNEKGPIGLIWAAQCECDQAAVRASVALSNLSLLCP